ncbi:MAG: hypothetical protein ABSF79_03670 [Smithellaceae bacterium]|jgi:DNA-directed RNA polymerase specialized sigma24 family protein
MNDKVLQNLIISLNSKLDAIIKLMVLFKSENKNQSELIWMLSHAGLQPKEIANMLGTSPNTVRVMLFAIRKQKGKAKKVVSEKSAS